MSSSQRRAKRFLTAEQKYDLWVRMLTGQISTVQAAAEAGVDRTTIAALEASRPGRRQHTAGENAELARLRGDVERLSAAIVEQAIELAALRGKRLGDERSGPRPR